MKLQTEPKLVKIRQNCFTKPGFVLSLGFICVAWRQLNERQKNVQKFGDNPTKVPAGAGQKEEPYSDDDDTLSQTSSRCPDLLNSDSESDT